jgi:flagellar biosynthesis/type III secretory pathway protein FliH
MQNLIDRIVGVHAPEQSRDAVAAVIMEARRDSYAAGRESAIKEFEKTINSPEFGAEIDKQLADVFDEGYRVGYNEGFEDGVEYGSQLADAAGETEDEAYHQGLVDAIEIVLEATERKAAA